MAFRSGNKKPSNSGRKKGTRNKRTHEALKRVEYVLSLLDDRIEHDIGKLTSRQRVDLWKDLQEYVRPKLARSGIDMTERSKELRVVWKVVPEKVADIQKALNPHMNSPKDYPEADEIS